GFLDLAGVLDDAPEDEQVEPVAVSELEGLLASGAVDVIDVREAGERDEGYIPGTRHAPYRVLRQTAEDVSDGRPVVTICESGARAAIAGSGLRAAGIDARPVVDGGITDWPGRTVAFRRCGA